MVGVVGSVLVAEGIEVASDLEVEEEELEVVGEIAEVAVEDVVLQEVLRGEVEGLQEAVVGVRKVAQKQLLYALLQCNSYCLSKTLTLKGTSSPRWRIHSTRT